MTRDWVFSGFVARVGPGFVLDCVLDLGFGRFRPVRLWLAGVGLPSGEAERERAMVFVGSWVDRGEREVVVRTVKEDGRYWGVFYQAGSERSLNDELLAEGHASAV